jgi:hypothetical protein
VNAQLAEKGSEKPYEKDNGTQDFDDDDFGRAKETMEVKSSLVLKRHTNLLSSRR